MARKNKKKYSARQKRTYWIGYGIVLGHKQIPDIHFKGAGLKIKKGRS